MYAAILTTVQYSGSRSCSKTFGFKNSIRNDFRCHFNFVPCVNYQFFAFFQCRKSKAIFKANIFASAHEVIGSNFENQIHVPIMPQQRVTVRKVMWETLLEPARCSQMRVTNRWNRDDTQTLSMSGRMDRWMEGWKDWRMEGKERDFQV